MSTHNPIVPICEIKPGKKITSFYVIRKKEVRLKRDGTPYLALELGADSGRIHSTLWNDIEAMNKFLLIGDIVKVRGSGILYHDHIQLAIERIRKVRSGDAVTHDVFLPRSGRNVNQIWEDMKFALQSVKTPALQSLNLTLIEDLEFTALFLKAPGGKLWHHACVGGLAEHTQGVLQICNDVVKHYPALNRDLVLTAAFLHDIGKIREFSMDHGFIDYSDEGRLIGHITLGAQMVSDKIRMVPDFPDSLKKHILHLILSHQGELAHASPVVPKTPEAMLLYYADEMDSKINALLHIQERDSDSARNWSHYVPVLDRFIYLKKENGDL